MIQQVDYLWRVYLQTGPSYEHFTSDAQVVLILTVHVGVKTELDQCRVTRLDCHHERRGASISARMYKVCELFMIQVRPYLLQHVTSASLAAHMHYVASIHGHRLQVRSTLDQHLHCLEPWRIHQRIHE